MNLRNRKIGNVDRKEKVDEVIELVRNAGGNIVKEPQSVFLGGYHAYFTDLDGYYTYDDKGNVTSETVRKTVLDIANDAVTVESFSDAVTTSWVYDKAGNILTEKDGNNHTTTFNLECGEKVRHDVNTIICIEKIIEH